VICCAGIEMWRVVTIWTRYIYLYSPFGVGIHVYLIQICEWLEYNLNCNTWLNTLLIRSLANCIAHAFVGLVAFAHNFMHAFASCVNRLLFRWIFWLPDCLVACWLVTRRGESIARLLSTNTIGYTARLIHCLLSHPAAHSIICMVISSTWFCTVSLYRVLNRW
jgi:hypothetical protein